MSSQEGKNGTSEKVLSSIKVVIEKLGNFKQIKTVNDVIALVAPLMKAAGSIVGLDGTEKKELVLAAIKHLINNSGLNVIRWPKDWVDEDGTKMLDILEMKQSVHLRPKYYPFLNEIL